MAQIRLVDIAHSYSGSALESGYALKPLDMTWQDGGTYALLGPSGCGKTTMLNIISGLVSPSEGSVWFGDRDVTRVPTTKRNIAQVFQFPVIYASMTVAANLAFPLVCRKWPRERIRRKVREIAELLDLGSKLGKPARSLTADEKQLISLGRGLVREDVAAVLMDEPLTVIDPQFKFHLRRKLKEITERFRLTVVYVTHDQNEAMTFAERVIVMSDGRVVQAGSPEELFEHPLTIYVGQFIGSPAMNFLDARIDRGAVFFGATPLATAYAGLPQGMQQIQLGIRPEYLEFVGEPGGNVLPVNVRNVRDHGSIRVVEVAVGGASVKLKLAREKPVPSGEALMRLPPEKIRIYISGEILAGAAGRNGDVG
ncbi:MAG: ABC transporter ATP-binding protein [Bauldia sp.]|nr:MAG: ABC transporter ATP-binding protein [Bauldia sp.]